MAETLKLYSLQEVERETGIPQRSILLLLDHYGNAIPFLVGGTRRRFPPEAIPVIVRFWREYTNGISEDGETYTWYLEIVDALLQSAKKLLEAADLLDGVRHRLSSNPLTVPFFINALPGAELRLVRPIGVAVSFTPEKKRMRAQFTEADLEAYGEDAKEAVFNLREVVVRTFIRLEGQRERSPDERSQYDVLSGLIRKG